MTVVFIDILIVRLVSYENRVEASSSSSEISSEVSYSLASTLLKAPLLVVVVVDGAGITTKNAKETNGGS